MKCKYYIPYMHTLRELCGHFYNLEGCGAGGPLHILLDDDNYDIDSINFCIRYCFDNLNGKYTPDYNPEVYILGIMICNEYAKMSLEQRAVFDAYLCGHDLNKCNGKCEECHLDEEFYGFMKEKEINYA